MASTPAASASRLKTSCSDPFHVPVRSPASRRKASSFGRNAVSGLRAVGEDLDRRVRVRLQDGRDGGVEDVVVPGVAVEPSAVLGQDLGEAAVAESSSPAAAEEAPTTPAAPTRAVVVRMERVRRTDMVAPSQAAVGRALLAEAADSAIPAGVDDSAHTPARIGGPPGDEAAALDAAAFISVESGARPSSRPRPSGGASRAPDSGPDVALTHFPPQCGNDLEAVAVDRDTV